MERREELEGDKERWVHDSSVDHKGRTPLRASTGIWKASFFIIVFEFTEKLCVFGLGINLIIYLTEVLHQDIKTAAKNVNYWTGVSTLTSLIGGFIADTYLGRFSMVLVSSLIYLAKSYSAVVHRDIFILLGSLAGQPAQKGNGLFLLTMSQFVHSLKPCNPNSSHKSLKNHEVVFYVAMFLTSIASGGYKPAIQSFGADQFDDSHTDERKTKMSFFNWWNFGLCSGMFLGVTVIAYVEDKVSWGVAYILLTFLMTTSFVIYLIGRPFYRYQIPQGSPLTPLIQVLVAALAKRHLPHPSDAAHLYEVSETQKGDRRLLCHTNRFRFLDKAAVIKHQDDGTAPDPQMLNRWQLATVTKVEEMKLILSIIPIWITSLPFNMSVAETGFFVKQASIMNRRISSSFEIPSASLFCLVAISMIITVIFYEKLLEPFIRRARKSNERGISILQRIGIGMAFSATAMILAALVERKRLKVADVEKSNAMSMSVFWLVPQFMMMGLCDGFALVGLQEYFYDQVPDNMRSIGMALYFSAIGVANFLGSILITVVDHVTRRRGNSWFAKDLNKSRLDNFYWLLATINAVTLCVYVYMANRYSYKSVLVGNRVGITNKS